MELHRANGRAIFIVSSSPEEVVRPLAEHLGPDVGVIATRAVVDEEGHYTGEMEFYCAGDNKAVAIRDLASRRGYDLPRSYAYSDSISDLPMLETVGHPVAVNPDRDLRRAAVERGWQVRDFRRPVRLRHRIARRPTAHPDSGDGGDRRDRGRPDRLVARSPPPGRPAPAVRYVSFRTTSRRLILEPSVRRGRRRP